MLKRVQHDLVTERIVILNHHVVILNLFQNPSTIEWSF